MPADASSPRVLSPRIFAEAVGVSESSMKRWIDAGLIRVSRTAGGHRRIPLAEAVRFVRERRMEILRPDLLGMPDLSRVEARMNGERLSSQLLVRTLLSQKADEASSLILKAYLNGESLTQLCDGPVRQALALIGDLWHHEERGIFIERRATMLCSEALNQMRLFIPAPEPEAPFAVGCAPVGDDYVLPSSMAALVLAETGYRETNLGPDTPLFIVERAVEETRTTLVWFSISVEQTDGVFATELQRFAGAMEQQDTAVVLGGRFARDLFRRPQPNITLLNSMSDLETFARNRMNR